MWKKVIAFVLILVLCVSVMWFANPLTPAITASADSYRSGFSIVPEKEDETGVALDSGFILSSETTITLDYVKANVVFREGDSFNFSVSAASDGKFLLKPSQPLTQNHVYFIDVKTQDGRTVSFAFQTKRDFTVLGSLPEKMSTEVPLDTGIEFYFSYPDVENIAKYFEISPKVEGRFESTGYTTVFIPKKLEPATLYTVKIKKGITAAKGAVALNEDYVFSFETAKDPSSSADPFNGSLFINNPWLEFGTAEKPAVPFTLYMNQGAQKTDVILKAYQFKTLDDFIKAIRQKEQVPSWAPYASSQGVIETSNLKKVLEFKQNFNLERWQEKYMLSPETLPQGFYLVELSCDKMTAQAFLQISDVSSYTVSDKANTLFWLNDLKTGTSIQDAEIYDLIGKTSQKTDASGLAKLPKPEKTGNGEAMTQDLYRVTASDGTTSLINTGYSYDTDYVSRYPYYSDGGLTWRYMQTDRTLYKPSDTVEFWGFIKSRLDGSSPKKVSVELSNGGYYYPMKASLVGHFLPFLSNTLETVSLETQNGFYEGSLALPALDPGSYTLTVKDGDQVLSSTYFSVENYIKPQYKLEITSDKKAVFVGEKITFTIKASFFDGTPVANVPLNYAINGYSSAQQKQGVTDAKGVLKVEYIPEYNSQMQGECYFGISANAQFPETGDISQYYDFRVFANDITFVSQGEIKENKGTVTITASAVKLDSLNDEDLANDNYVGAPVAGKELNLTVSHITWEKYETGDEYDSINKVVRKLYEYREKRTTLQSVTITTGQDGVARYEFPVDEKEEGYYITEITTKDHQERNMKTECWMFRNGKGYPQNYDNFYLKADKESYKANETVNLQVLKNEEPLKDMRTLFVESRNGLRNYKVMNQPSLSQPFPEAYAPNYYMDGIVFTGKSYIQTNCVVIYDYNEKKLNLEVKTDKQSYKPGENMTITVKATDKNGKPVSAKVNLSLVDEALLKLSGQFIDPLSQLYTWIDSGITRTTNSRGYAYGGYGAPVAKVAYQESGAVKFDSAMESPATANYASMDMMKSTVNGASYKVRSDFKDTALFKTLTLDEKGTGSYTFKLPDNITSFSLASAAVSSDLYAGSDIQSAKVSMPFFINDALSLDYLVGDKPYLGVTAYGEDLKEGEKVDFEVTIKEIPDYIRTGTAAAYERLNLALPTMEEGTYTLVIKAKSASGKTDALSRTLTVYPSYRTIETAIMKELAAGKALEGGKSGLTTLIFADAGKGSLINSLHRLSWDYGKRLDQKLVTNSARKLLMEIIKDEGYILDPVYLEPSEYKNEDGGYGILPYAGSDISFTALITPLLKEYSDTTALKMYFYNALLSDNKVQAPVLYALAELGEPVLLDLNRATATQNLTLDDTIYLGMAYEALGDTTTATDIYQRKISPSLERKDPYIRVKNKDTDKAYKQTALVAVLASRINSVDAQKLFAYVENNSSKKEYAGVEKILYLSDKAKKLPDTQASFTWQYAGKTETVDLKDGRCEIIKVPSVKLGEFKVTSVNGKVSVLSLYTASFTQDVKNDAGVTLTRKYYDAATGKETTTFKANDLVRIEISYTLDKSAIDNTYEVSDYCPAGLKPLENPWEHGIRDLMGCWYRQFDGQKVTFVIGKSNEAPKPLVYYARVASPGEYRAEGTVAQGSIVKSSLITIEDAKITINP